MVRKVVGKRVEDGGKRWEGGGEQLTAMGK
ncbi:hypothetical protein Tco_1342236, partial [Tanacetum coccineum]